MKQLFYFGFLSLLLLGCDETDTVQDVLCTEEFRTIGVTITGVEITDFFTIRESTGDTIKLDKFSIDDTFFPILDDSYQPQIENSQETFTFVGMVESTTVENIEEEYVIKADQCHIELVSGPTELNF